MTGSKRVERLMRKEQRKQNDLFQSGQAAVGYVRVSTDEQARKGYGMETQEKAIRAFAESQGYELIDVISDPGVSGATKPAVRPGFGKVLELAQAKAFTVLLVWKIDRLARSLVHAVTTADDLSSHLGIVLRSVTEPIDTSSAMGQTIFAILAGMAQQERQVITERTLAGKKAKAAKGGFAGSTAPYGYRTDGQGNLIIFEEEAEVVRLIFAMRASGNTLQRIADHLNSVSIPARRGGRWHPATVRYILDNPKYRGQVEYFFRWQDEQARVISEGEHEAIVMATENTPKKWKPTG
jgi:site-specific DNA recombinase